MARQHGARWLVTTTTTSHAGRGDVQDSRGSSHLNEPTYSLEHSRRARASAPSPATFRSSSAARAERVTRPGTTAVPVCVGRRPTLRTATPVVWGGPVRLRAISNCALTMTRCPLSRFRSCTTRAGVICDPRTRAAHPGGAEQTARPRPRGDVMCHPRLAEARAALDLPHYGDGAWTVLRALRGHRARRTHRDRSRRRNHVARAFSLNSSA